MPSRVGDLRIAALRECQDRLTILADDGRVLGFASFTDRQQDGRPEAGLARPHARGKGHASAAVTALGLVAHAEGHPEVWFGTRITNARMRRALERAGAEHSHDADHRLPNGEVAPSA